MKTQNPRTKTKDVRIAEIRTAAMQVFFSKGYQNSTVEEIAKRANVAKGTVYLYYKSKEDLYVGLVEPFLEELGYRAEKLHKELDAGKFANGPAFIEGLCEMLIDLISHNAEVFQIFQASQIGNLFKMLSEEILSALTARGKTNYQLLRSLLSRAIKLGLIREVEVHPTVDVILGMTAGVVQITEARRAVTGKDQTESRLRYACSLLYSGLRK